MKKLVILFIFALALANKAKSQTAVYFELGGPGIASFNVDTRFTGRNDGLGGRVGIGGFSVNDEGALFVPMGLNYLFGKNTKHFFEVGAGFTYVDYTSHVEEEGMFTTSFGHVSFGYRMQPAGRGFSFRAAIVPIFNKYGYLPYYLGVSFGYKF
jgi:hypothetical protein